MVATVIMAVLLLSAWAYNINHYLQQVDLAKNATPSPTGGKYDMVFVGRITGMRDCRWADPATQTYLGSSVPLGRKYALSSGLMEISYESGAKVILEGPCTFEVESAVGGYLALGKLTALVEKREIEGLAASAASRSAVSTNPQTAYPELRTPNPESLFAVRTPTAIVTDLGTEFGVQVGNNGDTYSYVFRGSISVAPVGKAGGPVVLGLSDSARVASDGEVHRVDVSGKKSGTPLQFVRAIPLVRRSYIDLADIVAGGDGFGHAKQHGIDAATGRVMPAAVSKFSVAGDHAYHRVAGLPLIDGVFVPDGGHGPVQLDSAGHRTSVLTDTDNNSWNLIWSGQIPGDEDRPIPVPAVSCWLDSVDYAGRGHSVLSLPPNKGITFDLAAIRRANPDARIVRFTAVGGNPEIRSDLFYAKHVSADLWVFVDGELRFSKTNINALDGGLAIDVPLNAESRFLTLVATDAGNGTNFDWTMFGDPRLEIKTNSQASSQASKVRETHHESVKKTPSENPANRKECRLCSSERREVFEAFGRTVRPKAKFVRVFAFHKD